MSTAVSIMAISLGAAIGANLRWGLSLWLNASHEALQWGTLAANLLGAWLVGLLLGYFTHNATLGPEWRLFAITGLCGALTTFSTFSLEIFGALQNGKWLEALLGVLLHVIGSLLMTGLGIYSFNLLRNA